jgi:hypothetical protein
MKVSMFGWEFLPNISGDLGTSRYGLTKSLSKLRDVGVTNLYYRITNSISTYTVDYNYSGYHCAISFNFCTFSNRRV